MEKDMIEKEQKVLLSLLQMEDVAEKKAKIHSRLLTETALAQEMEALATRHAERKKRLEKLATGKEPKEEKEEKGDEA